MIARGFVFLVGLLPQHALSRVVHALARWRWRPWKNALIRTFCKLYPVDLSEAVSADTDSYVSFNAFFTRALAPDLRPIDAPAGTLVSPVDGSLSEFGELTAGRLLQAKHQDYALLDLMGGDSALAAPFTNGRFATLYLSPRDYHRVHMPLGGKLTRMLHVPGRLYGVSQAMVDHVPGLFARNERVVNVFETEHGPMAVILVGAFGVGSIETVWAGEITPPHGARIRSWDYHSHPIELARGEEMGRFNLGSSVIVLRTADAPDWVADWVIGQTLRMGQVISAA